MGQRTASFVGLKPASRAASESKRNNRKTDSKHEVTLRRELWKRGFRFRKNVRRILGNPDIVFSRSKVLVFCDGDFWHGRNWKTLRKNLSKGTNSSYWLAKIQSNMKRDRKTMAALERNGWLVLRFWETDIHRGPKTVANRIVQIIRTREHNLY